MRDEQQQSNELETDSADGGFAPGEIVIGELIGFDAHGRPLVDFNDNTGPDPLAAISTQALTATHVGRQVALLFANGDPASPVIMGLIHNPLDDMLDAFAAETSAAGAEESAVSHEVSVDDKRLLIEAQEEIVLRCGEASITLTKAGKVLIKGKYLSNRSSGVNRILGASVQVN